MNFKKKVSGSWTDTPHYIHNTSTDTITTLPAVIHPTGTTATVGLKGNTLQSSIPSPTSPVMPQGTGERTGNLFDSDNWYSTYKASAGVYSGTVNNFYVINCKPFKADDVGKTFTFRMKMTNVTSTNVRVRFTSNGVATNGNNLSADGYSSVSFTVSSTDDSVGIGYGGGGGNEITLSEIMLNTGSTALPYEPYGVKIPISSASTTTPVYLGEVETTRKIEKYEFTGQETGWRQGSTFFFNQELNPDYLRAIGIITCMCSHYPAYQQVGSGGDVPEGYCSLYYAGEVQRFYIKDSNFATLEDFKAYLAQQYANGTPVTVWYVLAEPTAGIVNEPIRKIGDYADEVSGITIPTIAGANTISVDTTLQPSEITVNYKGWHPVTAAHERDSGQWD